MIFQIVFYYCPEYNPNVLYFEPYLSLMKNSTLKSYPITILDGYTDEPSCLGVPPYIAPLPRYVYGAIKNSEKNSIVNYLTIDEYRNGLKNNFKDGKIKIKRLFESKLLIIIASAIVPGRYLSAAPISFRETLDIAEKFRGVKFLGGACAKYGFGLRGRKGSLDELRKNVDYVYESDLDAGVYDYMNFGEAQDRLRTCKEWQSWSKLGTELVIQHPNFPTKLVVELEGGRGCVRFFTDGCSFCSEPTFSEPLFRLPKDVVDEVRRLSRLGLRHFRVGALSCIFSYWAKGIGDSETPTPNPKKVGELLTGIRAMVPKLKVLHLDNANPAVMAEHIQETKAILKIIVENCTGGNVLSFGLESADPKVIRANNLNTTVEQVEEMVQLVNRYGAKPSSTGLPMLLPGLNFVYGLKEESKDTFTLNFEFLKKLFDNGLMLRRINLRQVLPVRSGVKNDFKPKKYHHEFIRHKKLVREKIDQPMLERIIPKGTILKDVLAEKITGKITFCRQLGTYPILVGVPYIVELDNFYNVLVTDFGYRSITGFITPFSINTVSLKAISGLPGIGKKRASKLVANRPFKNFVELQNLIDDKSVLQPLEKHIRFDL